MKKLLILCSFSLLLGQEAKKPDEAVLTDTDRYGLAKLYLEQAQVILNRMQIDSADAKLRKSIDEYIAKLKDKCATKKMELKQDPKGDWTCAVPEVKK